MPGPSGFNTANIATNDGNSNDLVPIATTSSNTGDETAAEAALDVTRADTDMEAPPEQDNVRI